ncbi:ATP-binding cassette domain-containing protein [Morganella morganii]
MLKFDRLAIDVAQFSWLRKKRWQPLLTDISLVVQPSELVALVGSSGEGKSLLLQSALGLLPDNMRCRGAISLAGETLTEESKQLHRGNTLCYVPQGVSALNPLVRVGPQLERAATLSGMHVKMHDVARQLQRYNLRPELTDAFPNRLSGGMAKRVLTCGATLTGAQYILADEITSWLDDEHAGQILAHLKVLCADGRGVLWVTHDLAMAARFADRIAVLRHGVLQETLTSQALLNGEGSPWLQSLWDALPEHRFLAGRKYTGMRR